MFVWGGDDGTARLPCKKTRRRFTVVTQPLERYICSIQPFRNTAFPMVEQPRAQRNRCADIPSQQQKEHRPKDANAFYALPTNG